MRKTFLMLNRAFRMDSKEFFFFASSVFVVFLISDLILGFKWFYSGISFREDFISSYRMIAVLRDGLSEEEVVSALNAIKMIDGVRDVVRLKKEDVVDLVSKFINAKKMMRFIPDILEIYINEKWAEDIGKIKLLEEKIGEIGAIEFLDSAKESLESAIKFISYVKNGGRFFILSLGFAGILIIYSFIYLTIYSIHKKIEIMKFVGASSGFIKVPLIIRGIIAGILGSFLSLLFMKFLLHSEVILKEFLFILLYSVSAGGIGSYLALRSDKI